MIIHYAINAAMRDIAAQGIGKNKQASLGGASVAYRGIEDAMNQMCVILIRHKITVVPEYSDIALSERVKGDPKDAKATRFATLRGRFTFSAEDGSCVSASCYGEAMDSGDKAVTKAQSVAFRTALFQLFVIPTMAMDPEADAQPDDDAQAMGTDEIAAHTSRLKGAATVDELRLAWTDADAAAKSTNDRAAWQEFKAAKDARLKELK